MRRLRVFLSSAVILGCVSDDSAVTKPDAGGDASDAAAAAFCATHTTGTTMICADFDTALDAGWTTTNVSEAGATLALDTTDPVSPPNALVASIKPSTSPIAALLELDPVGAPSAFSGILRMKVKVPACFQAADHITIAELQFFASNVPVYDVQLQIGINGGTAVYAGNYADSGTTGKQFGASQLLPLNAWTDVELDLTTSGTPHANLVQQGQIVVSADLLPGTAPGLPRFSLGAAAPTLAGSNCNIAFDNVTLDRQ